MGKAENFMLARKCKWQIAVACIPSKAQKSEQKGIISTYLSKCANNSALNINEKKACLEQMLARPPAAEKNIN